MSQLTDDYGTDGVLVFPRSPARERAAREVESTGADGAYDVYEAYFEADADATDPADIMSAAARMRLRSALVWPPCRCGSPKCPDYVAPPSLRERVADLNEQSRKAKP